MISARTRVTMGEPIEGAFGGFYQQTGRRRGATVVVVEPWHLTGKRGQEPEQSLLED